MPVDLSPLLRGAPAERVRVAGLALGDAAFGVDRAQITGGEDDAPEARTYTQGSVFRRNGDGELVEVPLAERIDGALQRGGVLRCGEVAIRVKGGLVEAIFVRGPALTSLPIQVEADIELRLGAPAGTRWSAGRREYHYPERRVVVVWDPEAGRIDYVALTGASWHEPRLGARDLLSELLSCFDGMARHGWNEPREPGSLRVRHQRASALVRALDLGSIANVVNGTFLEGPLSPERVQVLAEVASVGPRAGQASSRAAPMLFTGLLSYRRNVEVVIRATAGWLECGDAALLAMITTQDRIAAAVKELMVDVDRWICALVDPLGRTFELRTLIAQHGWPDVDVIDLEREELWG
jgi:hypothetical protein